VSDALDNTSDLFAKANTPPPTAATAQQSEIPFAMVRGQPFFEPPKDLYIPPDALEVILDAFEGPLDLLLYLIRKQNLEILDIPVAQITQQYISYIELMQDMRFELAAEYLVMAAILCEIKSRLLLPRPPSEPGIEEDPRAELVRRLQEYERFKKAAQDIDALPRMERDFLVAHADVGDRKAVVIPPEVELKELLLALKDVLHRADLFTHHQISREPLSVRVRMSELLSELSHGEFRQFIFLFDATLGRRAIVVTFLAILELSKEGLLEIVQEGHFEPIYVRTHAASE
jgi:segregation and condensation protein A